MTAAAEVEVEAGEIAPPPLGAGGAAECEAQRAKSKRAVSSHPGLRDFCVDFAPLQGASDRTMPRNHPTALYRARRGPRFGDKLLPE